MPLTFSPLNRHISSFSNLFCKIEYTERGILTKSQGSLPHWEMKCRAFQTLHNIWSTRSFRSFALDRDKTEVACISIKIHPFQTNQWTEIPLLIWSIFKCYDAVLWFYKKIYTIVFNEGNGVNFTTHRN